jgi:hypothetical protein
VRTYLCAEHPKANRRASTVPHLCRKETGVWIVLSSSQYGVHVFSLHPFPSNIQLHPSLRHLLPSPALSPPLPLLLNQTKLLTIVRPLIPIIKSNQGSRGTSRLAFLSTWKPYAPFVADCCSSLRGAASSRDMKRFNAPNMDMMRGSDRGDPAGRLLYEDDDRAVVMVKVSLLVTWRFWKVAIARICSALVRTGAVSMAMPL